MLNKQDKIWEDTNSAYLVKFFDCYRGRDCFKATGSRVSACSLIKLFISSLLLILSVNNPTHLYLSDLRVFFKVELYSE